MRFFDGRRRFDNLAQHGFGFVVLRLRPQHVRPAEHDDGIVRTYLHSPHHCLEVGRHTLIARQIVHQLHVQALLLLDLRQLEGDQLPGSRAQSQQTGQQPGGTRFFRLQLQRAAIFLFAFPILLVLVAQDLAGLQMAPGGRVAFTVLRPLKIRERLLLPALPHEALSVEEQRLRRARLSRQYALGVVFRLDVFGERLLGIGRDLLLAVRERLLHLLEERRHRLGVHLHGGVNAGGHEPAQNQQDDDQSQLDGAGTRTSRAATGPDGPSQRRKSGRVHRRE